MKKLILIRHAESSTPENTEDFNRPLSDRGHAEARKMAAFLKQKDEKIDAFITSPAKRALTTCRYFAETFGNKNIKKIEGLYECSAQDFQSVIQTEPDENRCIALFSNNPGITDFVSFLAKKNLAMPTCGVAVFEAETANWLSFFDKEIILKEFSQPSEI